MIGPTQVGKTSSVVIPALLRWTDALVVTSVKSDVIATTLAWRRSLGDVQILEPGRDGGLTWNPLEGVHSLRHAFRVARDLTLGPTDRGDTEFWNSLATKLIASLLMIAKQRSWDVFAVAAAIERRNFEGWVDLERTSDAVLVLDEFLRHEPRTLDGVLTTAETMMMPWRFSQPLATARTVVAGANTLYLCSPRGEQRHYEALFRGALRMVLEEQQRLVDERRQRRLLLVLDEAATVASLDELDQMAATVSGLDVTLVTVVQDFAQLKARWGARASTIVNNHTTRVVMGGLADPTVSQYLPEILAQKPESAPPVPLRQRPPGSGIVVAGHRPPFEVRFQPWWNSRLLRSRGVREGSLRFPDGADPSCDAGSDFGG